MSENDERTYKVPLTEILEVNDHPNADRLDVVTVYGFQVVAKKGQYQPGDKVIYIPIDSILSPELEYPPASFAAATRCLPSLNVRLLCSG